MPTKLSHLLSLINNRKVAVFIDLSNMLYSQKDLHWDIDYQKLINFLQLNSKLQFAIIYSGKDSKNKKQNKFFRKLSSMGYIVKTKEVKWIKDKKGKIIKGKGNLDIELALDLTHKIRQYDICLLFSGDSDFVPAIDFAKQHNRRVIVFSTRGHIAKELTQISDLYIPFSILKGKIKREKK